MVFIFSLMNRVGQKMKSERYSIQGNRRKMKTGKENL